MRKLIICLAIASVAVSCKKIQAGGNKGTIKLEEGAERYSDDVQGGGETHGHDATTEHKEDAVAEKHGAETSKTDSATASKPVEAEKAKTEH